MIYLLLSIICSTSIFILFKSIERFKINTFNAILVNYLIATAIGLSYSKNPLSAIELITDLKTSIIIILIGSLFISMFFIIARSSIKNGIAITSISSKMSVIIPIIFSMIYYNELIFFNKMFAIFLAVISIILTIYKKKIFKNSDLLLPIILFFGLGIMDSLVKYSQTNLLSESNTETFTALCFGTAGLIGIIILIFKKDLLLNFTKFRNLIFGTLLGLFNYGSMYFLILALNTNFTESSIIFGLNNLGIVLLTVLFAILFYKEKLNFINFIGIILSIITISILSFI